jgi:hypothetical protein
MPSLQHMSAHLLLLCRPGALVVDLYAGCKEHGREFFRALIQHYIYVDESRGYNAEFHPVIVLLSIDIKTASEATLNINARGLTPVNIVALKAKFPKMLVCTPLSVCLALERSG